MFKKITTMHDCCKKLCICCTTQDHSAYEMDEVGKNSNFFNQSVNGDDLFDMIEEEAVVMQDKKDSVEYKEHLTRFENKLKESEDHVDVFLYPHQGK